MAIVRAILILLLAAPAMAGSLSNFWVTDGGYKQCKEDRLPETTCSTCTITANWNGDRARFVAAKKEEIFFVVYMGNPTGSNVTSVNVSISSFTGTSGGGIANTGGLQWGTTGFTQPINQFYVRYLPWKGVSRLSYDPTEYDECQLPQRTRARFNRSGPDDNCALAGGASWSQRADHDKNFPDILVPYSLVASSSFTVAAGSSQAVGFTVFISSTLTANATYSATITIKEGVTVSTQIPVLIYLHNATMPSTPAFRFMTYMSDYNISYRHHGEHFPNINDEPYRTTRLRYYQMLHANGMSPIGVENLTNDYPLSESYIRLKGTLYSGASNYIYAPFADAGDKTYSIGTYGSWRGEWGNATTNSTTLCNHLSAYSNWFKNNSLTDVLSIFYTIDETLDGGNVAKWSNWASTVTACQVSGYTIYPFVTYNWEDTRTGAPYIKIPATTNWLGHSSTTIQAAYNAFHNPVSSYAWAYNGGIPGGPHSYDMSDDGTAPRSILWSDYKKGVDAHFLWESTYFTDSNESGNDNDVWTNAVTFGNYAKSFDSVRGLQCAQMNNNDGLLMYPGTDTVYTGNSYGVDVPFPSWRLKMYARGIQDAAYYQQALVINPTAANTALLTGVNKVLWEYQCADLGDCTYAYGERGWSKDPSVFENAKMAWGAIIDAGGGTPEEYCGDGICNGSDTCSNCSQDCGICPSSVGKSSFGGTFRFTGGGTFR